MITGRLADEGKPFLLTEIIYKEIMEMKASISNKTEEKIDKLVNSVYKTENKLEKMENKVEKIDELTETINKIIVKVEKIDELKDEVDEMCLILKEDMIVRLVF